MFSLGQVVATPGALELIGHEGAYTVLSRHASGDWGDLGDFDKRANDHALLDGTRIFSAYEYELESGKVWVITEADRSSTCILLPEEY